MYSTSKVQKKKLNITDAGTITMVPCCYGN